MRIGKKPKKIAHKAVHHTAQAGKKVRHATRRLAVAAKPHAQKIAHKTRRAAAAAKPHVTKAAHTTRRAAKKTAKKTAVYTVAVSKYTHHHAARRPHLYLLERWPRYNKWHNWDYHKHVHIITFGLYVFLVLLLVFSSYRATFAASDLFNTWDFADAEDYTLDSGIETIDDIARLKAQNYESDSNTSALYHFDESNGDTVADSSANNNDAAASEALDFVTGNLNNALDVDPDNPLSASDSASLSHTFANSVEGWVKFDESFAAGTHNHQQTVVDKGAYRLGFDHSTGKLSYEMANSGATAWSQVAGNGLNNSWTRCGKYSVTATANDGTNLYVGLYGCGSDDAEVWRWGDGSWTQIGGDGKNGSWSAGEHERVASLAYDGGKLYAGLGNNSGDGDVWMMENGSWTKIGGDSLNNGWTTGYDEVTSMMTMNGNLYVGLGRSNNEARVYKWNGSTWEWIGGFGISGYNAFTTGYEFVSSLANDGTNIYAGMSDDSGDADVWRFDGAAWTQIGGDSLKSGWTTGYENVWSLYHANGILYAGLGRSASDGELWSFADDAWTKLGGDGTNSSWNGHPSVRAITGDGSNVYVGLGDSNNNTEVWQLNDGSWTQIGGDGVNGGFISVDMNRIESMTYFDNKLYIGAGDSGSYVWMFDGNSWTPTGGQGVNESWGILDLQAVTSMVSYNGKLYAGTGFDEAGNATVWEYDGSQWRIVGGQTNRGSWHVGSHEVVNALIVYDGNLYAGLGASQGDGEVWRYDGTSWTLVGGDGNGWADNTYEDVLSFTVHDGKLYTGLGRSNPDGEIWQYDGENWTQVGGDGIGGSWTTSYQSVRSMASYRGHLYVGLGDNANDAEVWQLSSGSWTKVGEDVNNSWAAGTFEAVQNLVVYNDQLCAGLGTSSGDSDIWCFDENTWTQIGGDGVNSSWSAPHAVYSLSVYNGDLYAGLGGGGYSDVWRYRNGSWTMVAGNSNSGLNASWISGIDYVWSMAVHDGKLYTGLGFNANNDAQVWAYGNNATLQSATDSFDDSWHHVAATYDGETMKLFIDGELDASKNISNLMPDTAHPLKIGSNFGSAYNSEPAGSFQGAIDEVRLSKTARSSFTTRPYVNTRQIITLNDAARTSGVAQWDSFSADESTNGGTITYRLSADDGATWLYHDGEDWVVSNNEAEANTASEINDVISDFPVTFYGLKWQAILHGDGQQRVTLNSVTAEASSDITAPSANASNIAALKAAEGAPLTENAWTNGGSPYFAWDAGTDDNGIKGYCLYLGQDESADPVSTKGLLGSSPHYTGNHCQFMVEDTEIDLAAEGYLQTALTTSDDPYYLHIKAIDAAGNTTDAVVSFAFRFDNEPPTNPAFVSAPAGFVSEKELTITWPTTGQNAPADAQSGLAGLQYRINNTTWYGDDHTGSGDITDLLANDGSYTTQDSPDFDNLVDGVNTIYFRTWDNAGNVTTTYTTGTVRLNTAGAPTEPQNVQVSPATNTSNAFSFEWDAPASFVGEAANLTYCYTVNTLPSNSTCTFTSAGVTSLGAGPYATQPGVNTFYVVARDETSAINYSSYATTSFSANTPSPGMATNVDVVDVSVKATSNWRLALTWDVPTNVGAGIASYKVFRSTDNNSFSQIGSSASTTFIDSGLSQQRYYYRIQACDNTNNCGANSTVVSDTPTGRFTEPATLVSSPVVSNVTTKKATITWSTNRDSDSRIALGTTSGKYSSSEVTVSDQTTSHTVELDNLSAGTTYYFVAKWTDEDGNTGQSQEYVFKTSPAPSLKEIQTVRVGLSTALVQFTSRNAVKASVMYGPTEAFGGIETINTSSAESTYNLELEGLSDGTKYFYKVVTYDNEGTSYDGSIFSFTTPARPRITNLQFQPVKGEPTSTQRVTWQTNVPANSTVTYGKQNTNGSDILDSKLKTNHEITIRGLEDNSEYFLIAQSRDANGIIAVSDRQVFETALDTRPPKVYDIRVESSIRGLGAEARGQIIVSWKTDELATSQVAYSEGSNPSVFNNRTTEDGELATEHVVIISDLPTSRVFSVQPVSADRAGNKTGGSIESTIIGRATEGVLSIVLTTLQRIFGL